MLKLTRRAVKELRALPPGDRRRMADRLKAHAEEPNGCANVVALQQYIPGGYRLRSGRWRALFTVDGDEMVVHHIRSRTGAYR